MMQDGSRHGFFIYENGSIAIIKSFQRTSGTVVGGGSGITRVVVVAVVVVEIVLEIAVEVAVAVKV